MFEKIREKLTGIAKENEEEIVFNKLDEGNIELRDEVEKRRSPSRSRNPPLKETISSLRSSSPRA